MQYPIVDGVVLQLIVKTGVQYHGSGRYKVRVENTGIWSRGQSGPLAFRFEGKDDRLFVSSIIKWAHNGYLLLFYPGSGVTLEHMQAFFSSDTIGMSMIVEWCDATVSTSLRSCIASSDCVHAVMS